MNCGTTRLHCALWLAVSWVGSGILCFASSYAFISTTMLSWALSNEELWRTAIFKPPKVTCISRQQSIEGWKAFQVSECLWHGSLCKKNFKKCNNPCFFLTLLSILLNLFFFSFSLVVFPSQCSWLGLKVSFPKRIPQHIKPLFRNDRFAPTVDNFSFSTSMKEQVKQEEWGKKQTNSTR